VGVFEEIFAVIGDEQSIGENLSTFSSHLLHVNEVIEKSGHRSLSWWTNWEWERMRQRMCFGNGFLNPSQRKRGHGCDHNPLRWS